MFSDNEFVVDIPEAELWTNGVEAKFIISFRTYFDKKAFLKKYHRNEDIRINCYVYSKCKIQNIHNTNMIRCHALQNYDDTHILQDFLAERFHFNLFRLLIFRIQCYII